MYNLYEIWKPIKGFEGYYEVSNLGSIRSCDRFINDKGGKRFKKSQLIKPRYSHNGYLRIKLMKKSKAYHLFVHRLVCESFHGKRNSMEVNHINFIKDDNRSCNLEWTSKSNNIQYSYNNLNSDKASILLDLNSGVYYYSIRDASRITGVNHRTLHSMITGRVKNKTSLVKV